MQHWTSNSRLVVDHVLAGSFECAFRLVEDQIGAADFEALRPLFLSTYTRSRTAYTGLAYLPSLYSYPLRNWQEGAQKNVLPAIGCRLDDLVQRLQLAYNRWQIPRSSRKIPINPQCHNFRFAKTAPLLLLSKFVIAIERRWIVRSKNWKLSKF